MRKNIIILLVFMTLGACKTNSHKLKSNCDKLALAITSEEFNSFYKLCNKEENTVQVYNSTNLFLNCSNILMDCDKNVEIVKMNFQIDINSPRKEKISRIVLYRFENTKSGQGFYFIDTQSNATLHLTYNKEGQLINIQRGAF